MQWFQLTVVDAAMGQFFCYLIITVCIRYNEDPAIGQAANSQWAKASVAFFFLYYVFFGIGWQGEYMIWLILFSPL
jgi:hypothetical protein